MKGLVAGLALGTLTAGLALALLSQLAPPPAPFVPETAAGPAIVQALPRPPDAPEPTPDAAVSAPGAEPVVPPDTTPASEAAPPADGAVAPLGQAEAPAPTPVAPVPQIVTAVPPDVPDVPQGLPVVRHAATALDTPPLPPASQQASQRIGAVPDAPAPMAQPDAPPVIDMPAGAGPDIDAAVPPMAMASVKADAPDAPLPEAAVSRAATDALRAGPSDPPAAGAPPPVGTLPPVPAYFAPGPLQGKAPLGGAPGWAGGEAPVARPGALVPPVAAPRPPVPPEADLREAQSAEAVAPPAVLTLERPVPVPPRSGFTPPPGVTVGRLPRIGAPSAPEAPPEPIPAVEADPDAPPLIRHARPFDNPTGRPPFAVVLIDDGAPTLDRRALAALPVPVTFALDPLQPGAALAASIYREAGQEVVMLVAGLPQGAAAQDVEVNLAAFADALPEAVAVMDAETSGFQDNRLLAGQVVPVVKAQGRGLLSWDRGLNAAAQVARREGLAAATILRRIDADGESAITMRRYLDRAAFKAVQDGRVVVAGTTAPETVATLLAWAVEGRASSVTLAPLSAVMRP